MEGEVNLADKGAAFVMNLGGGWQDTKSRGTKGICGWHREEDVAWLPGQLVKQERRDHADLIGKVKAFLFALHHVKPLIHFKRDVLWSDLCFKKMDVVYRLEEFKLIRSSYLFSCS